MKQNSILLWVFMLMNFMNGLSGLMFNGILDKVSETLHISIATTGYLTTAYSLGAALGVPVVLLVFAKAPRKPLMISMLGLTLVSILGVIVAPTFPILLAFRVLMGVTGNSYGILAISTVSALSSKERQGRSLAFLIMGNALAMIVGVPLTRMLSAILDWKGIFGILMGLIVLAMLYFLKALPSKPNASEKSSIKEELQYLKSPQVSLIILFTFVMFTGYSALYTYSTPYIVQRFPEMDPWMGFILIGIGLAAFTGNHIGGQLSDKLGFSKSMMVGAILQFIMVILLILFRGQSWLSALLMMALVLCAWITGLQLNLGILQSTHHDAHFILSLNGTGIQMGYALGSIVGSLVISTYGLSSLGFIGLVSTSLIVLIQGFALRLNQ